MMPLHSIWAIIWYFTCGYAKFVGRLLNLVIQTIWCPPAVTLSLKNRFAWNIPAIQYFPFVCWMQTMHLSSRKWTVIFYFVCEFWNIERTVVSLNCLLLVGDHKCSDCPIVSTCEHGLSTLGPIKSIVQINEPRTPLVHVQGWRSLSIPWWPYISSAHAVFLHFLIHDSLTVLLCLVHTQ